MAMNEAMCRGGCVFEYPLAESNNGDMECRMVPVGAIHIFKIERLLAKKG
jgi:hypothetical protein